MKLNPQKAPLYGECVLTVQLDDEHSAEQQEEEEGEFYLIFSGSTQRHVSSTLRVSSITLQAMCPGHNVCEQVLVTLCLARPDGTVDARSQQSFSFVQDLALNMTHFLLDSTAAQEALLLSSEQNPVEAERLDESLDLKHVSQPQHGTAPKAPCNTHTGVEEETVTVTDTHRSDTGMDVSSLLNSCPAVSECQQPSSLLHLAASHSLKTVPSFLLQQPGGKEALRRTNTQGSTPACLAKSRGQQQLLELFPHYATFSDVQAGAKETLQVYPKGVFEHHASVGTYTLTFLLQSEGGAEADSRGHCCLQEDVKELRRLIQLHRHTEGSIIPSLEQRTHGDDSAAVSQTSGTSAHFCQRQEKGRKHKGTPAAKSAGRNKRNKKRTTKITRPAAAESSGNQSREAAQRPCTATGSGTLSSRERAVATVTNDTGIQETPSPIRPVLGPGVERKCAGRKAVALPTTSIVDKQEGQKQEVELLMRKLVSKTGRDAQSLRAEISVESAAEGTVTMGQEQSQDPQDIQAEQEEPSLVNTMEKSPQSNTENSPKSTHTERKGRRVLWQDGGLTGSRMGSEAVGKTTWYMGDTLEQVSNEDSSRKEVNSQSVWYDADTMVERNPEQLEEGRSEKKQCDMSSPQALGLSSPQPVEQGLSAALSQAHAAGKQPALSHGPDAQRQEVHGSQQEEEVRSDWKKAGVEGVSNREKTYSRSISETADSEGGGEKVGSEEKPAKGRKRRRKKRGKKGGAEAKLSSSSSTESQSYSERQPESQQATNSTIQSESETERADEQRLPASEPTWGEEADEDAMQLPSHTEIQTHNAPGADGDVTNVDCSFVAGELSQADRLRTDWTEVTASHTEKRNELSEDETVNVDDLNPNSVIINSELSETDVSKADIKGITTVQPVAAEEFDSGELESNMPAILVQPTLDNVEPNEDLTVTGTATESVIRIGLVNSKCPEEGSSFPEQDTPQSVDSDKPVHSVDPTGRTVGSVESVCPTAAAFVPSDDRTDVSSLHIREGSTETTAREYLEHCLAPEMLRGPEYKEKKTHDTWEGPEEGVTERSQSDENGSGSVRVPLCSINEGRQVKENYDEDLVAAAVAVVTVAIASAVASIELSQHLVGSMSESYVCAGIEAVDSPSLAQETSLASKQLQHDLLHTVQVTQLSPQLISRAVTQADTENQPSHISSLEQAEVSGESGSVEIQSICNAGGSREGQLSSQDQANCELPASADAPSSPKHANEEIQKETLHNKVSTYSLPKEDNNQLKFHPKPLPEAGEVITAEEDRHDRVQTVILLHGDSLLHSAVTDIEVTVTDQNPPLREPENEPICPKEGAGQQLTSHFRTGETPERCDGLSVESRNADSEVGWHYRSEESESCENNSPHLSACDSQVEENECHPQLAGMPCQSEPPTFPLSCGSARPVTPNKSCSPADATPEEPAAPANVESGEILSSQSSATGNSVTAIPLEAERDTNQREAPESVLVNNKDAVFEGLDEDTLDTVDGFEDGEKKGGEVEARKEMPRVEDTSQTEAAKEEERDGDSAHALQIQRESHMLYPVQPSLEHSALTPCEDRGTCVSLCLVHRDSELKDGLKVSAELGDDVIQKPEAPPTCVGHRDIQTCVSQSSTENASMQEAVSPSKGALSGGTSQSSTQSWMSEIDRGGGETEGAGDEEEKKDGLPETSASAVLRTSICSSSLFRRHSWEPGRNSTAAQTDLSQCSLPVPSFSSLKSLSREVKQARSLRHRRSLSWCPSNLVCPDQEQIDNRSHSLDSLEVGRSVVQIQTQHPSISDQEGVPAGRSSHLDSQDRGSLASLTEEEQEGDSSSIDSQISLTASCSAMVHHPTLSKSMSMVTITQRDIQGVTSFSSYSGSLTYSISEDEPGPLQSETEGKGGPKISRTISYLRSKMGKKSKDKEKRGESKQESKEREKLPVCPAGSTVCQHSTRRLCNKETFYCNNCGVHVSNRSTESPSVCAKTKTKQQSAVSEGVPGSSVNMRSKATSSTSSLTSTASSSSREHWSAVTTPDDQLPVLSPRRHPSIFNPHSNLAKSVSSINIASLEDVPLKGLKHLSQSTDSLHQGSKVNASTESLTDEGTELIDSQLMEFEHDIKYLEADSWSGMVDKKFLKTLKKDEIKRQDVIYELYQTEAHHVRTLKIMSEVYYKGLQKELQLDTQTLKKVFPVLDELGEMHTEFLSLLLDRKRAASAERQNSNNFLICSIGDVLVKQFSGCSSVRMKKIYGKFCSRHNEAVNLYKELHAKDKRFQAFIKKTMSSSVVRRLSIPECILLVTQRITKYPVLIQRILQHTRESDEDHSFVSEALRCVKELITAVDGKVNEQEKKRRLKEVYSRTDSKSIMRMKSGQMFAKEDLIRGRKLLHDGALQLKNSAGRLKDVHAMLLSDVLVFLQEKDQKYVFASLDQRSTVISLHNLIVREVANEERGLFLITAGTDRPEMVEVLASSKEERNTWRAIIQDAMNCMEKDEDEGVPSETEEDRKQQQNRTKEIREFLQKKDEEIIFLLEEKVRIFRELGNCSVSAEDANTSVRERLLFRATPENVMKGEPVINDAVREVEILHALVGGGVGAAGCVSVGLTGASVGAVCLPRRAETFGGFDSHQMNSSKNGEKEEGDESLDLRRTESDSVLKKGTAASLQMLLKRNNEQLQRSVTYLHELLVSLQAVVIQQDSFIEDQRQALNSQLTTSSTRHSFSSSSSSSSSSLSSLSTSRPSSLSEQEKHRSLERQRQEAASLKKQQAAHQEEKRKREREWELKEKALAEREKRLREEEEESRRRRQELTEEMQMLQRNKEEYHREVEWLREAQRRLERDEEALRRDAQRLDVKTDQSEQLQRYHRTPSTTSDDSLRFHSTGSLDLDSKEAAQQPKEVELSSSAPTKEHFLRIGSKRMSKNLNPFSSASSSKAQGAQKESQLPSKLLLMTKPKEKKDKKKKKGKGGQETPTENKVGVMLDASNESDIFFC
ncbi:A-kinase anchor protein 13-like isoform X2 [Archocentrus centrarchus]|uniref:A-kinase anchor protein 13-like isoform X2 n=1 Tax=Archocentrus centrarchus TaxID=63155 RepID=UPI0011EA527E|nr:A-kinase anchor protein 13-like isoform X2 [Archocentrus centrarchus]